VFDTHLDADTAAADSLSLLRQIPEKVSAHRRLTVCLFLDGENALEYYPDNGREFLREFYRRIEPDPDFRALAAGEAVAAAAEIPSSTGSFPASWINANFDVWIGHSEDVTAWELLWDTREVSARGVEP